MTNTQLLNKAIEDSGLKISRILEYMGIKAYATLRDKIENKREFTAREITQLCDILNLDNDQREAIFFAKDAEYYSA